MAKKIIEFPWSPIAAMQAWEKGILGEAGTVKLFQYLVDAGAAGSMGGAYAAEADRLIAAGLVTKKE